LPVSAGALAAQEGVEPAWAERADRL